MIDLYVEIEYLLTNCANFDAEFDRVTDEVFALEQVNESVYDTSQSGNRSTQTIIFTCFVKGSTIQEAIAASEQLVKQSIRNSGTSTWNWVWTNAYDGDAELDYDKAIYTAGVAVQLWAKVPLPLVPVGML